MTPSSEDFLVTEQLQFATRGEFRVWQEENLRRDVGWLICGRRQVGRWVTRTSRCGGCLLALVGTLLFTPAGGGKRRGPGRSAVQRVLFFMRRWRFSPAKSDMSLRWRRHGDEIVGRGTLSQRDRLGSTGSVDSNFSDTKFVAGMVAISRTELSLLPSRR